MIIPNNFKLGVDRPRFIVFEGGNGAGKSTLQKRIEKRLRTLKKEVVVTREPGGTALGKEIRRILQEMPDLGILPMTELFLFAADRYQHVHAQIKPALENNQWVLCDRYYYSTLAFQGYGRSVSLTEISSLMEQAIAGLYPDLVVLVDIEPQTGLSRAKGRGAEGEDRFEQESLEFHRKVREGFLAIAHGAKEPFLIVSGEDTPDEVFEAVCRVIF